MKVRIEIMGPIKRKHGENPITAELPDGANLQYLMKQLGYNETEAKFLVYVRGEERLRLNSTLCENDEIKAVLQVGGG
ncbi:MAG: hypothetical protein LWY06_12795 [Firmicutes bacterium]|nr:hypothetical protein [Bacillota bacterium]